MLNLKNPHAYDDLTFMHSTTDKDEPVLVVLGHEEIEVCPIHDEIQPNGNIERIPPIQLPKPGGLL